MWGGRVDVDDCMEALLRRSRAALPRWVHALSSRGARCYKRDVPAASEDSHDGPDLEVVRRSASRWRWVLALTVLAMTALVWGTWVEITTYEKKQALSAAARRQGNLSIAVGQYLTRALGNADAVAQYLAGVHASPEPDFAGQLASRARANTLFAAMWTCQEDGTLLSAGTTTSDGSTWCKAWLDAAPADAKTFAGRPVRAGDATLVPLLTRLPAGGGRAPGVLALLVDVGSLLGVMQEYRIPDETVVLVAGADDRVRARWHNATRVADQRAPEAALLPAVLAAATLGQQHQVEGRLVLASARRVQPYPLTVLITTSVPDTLAESNRRSRYFAAAAGLATGVIALFALVLLRLQNQAVRSAESLGRARQRLQALNDELEEQVRARTGELEGAYRDLEAFSYTVAHDVRAPLAAISGFADALAPTVEATGDPKASHYLRRILANASQMNQLTESLLELGKLSRPAMVSLRVDLTALAHDVVAGLREREHSARAVEVTIQDAMEVQGDPVLLRQVLENLLGNAWKFSAARSPAVIGVTAQGDDGWTTVAIRDNGEGFESSTAVDLFKPFRRMHAADAFPGTGVGLATVDRILRLHGGSTWIESSPQGGTTVSFRIRTAGA
jgi:signal transduction histidine kinase